MIYTSNFYKLNSKNSNKFTGKELVGIVRIPPKNIHPRVVFDTLIAPNRKLLRQLQNKEITEEQYRQAYIKQLDRVGLDTILQVYDNKVLLCYCGEHSFCHRHILREWLALHKIKSIEI